MINSDKDSFMISVVELCELYEASERHDCIDDFLLYLRNKGITYAEIDGFCNIIERYEDSLNERDQEIQHDMSILNTYKITEPEYVDTVLTFSNINEFEMSADILQNSSLPPKAIISINQLLVNGVKYQLKYLYVVLKQIRFVMGDI